MTSTGKSLCAVGLAVALAACGAGEPLALAGSAPIAGAPSHWASLPTAPGLLLAPGGAGSTDSQGAVKLGAASGVLAHPESRLLSPLFTCCALPRPGAACQLRFTLDAQLSDGEQLLVSLASEVGPPDGRALRSVQGHVVADAAGLTYSLSLTPCGAQAQASFSWLAGRDDSSVQSQAVLRDVQLSCVPQSCTNQGPGVTGTLWDSAGEELPRQPRAAVLD